MNTKKMKISALAGFVLLVIALSLYSIQREETVYIQPQSDNIYSINKAAVFEPVLPNNPVAFPRDFAFHPEFQNEKWHYFANLFDEKGISYSVQWTYTRISRDEDISGGWKSAQLYIAQMVITANGRVWKQQRIARGGLGQAGLRGKPFRLWIDNWVWKSLSVAPLPSVLVVSADTFSLSLKSMGVSPYMAEGEQGYQEEHRLLPIASYRFQVPLIRVSGELILDGKRVRVSGNASLTKEWNSDSAIESIQKQARFNLELEDGSHLNLTRNKLNALPSHVYGTYVTKNGKSEVIENSDIVMTPITYTTLKNGKKLPLKWTISIEKLNIHLVTEMINQEMWHSFIQPYWLGPTSVSGNLNGRGALKLMGY